MRFRIIIKLDFFRFLSIIIKFIFNISIKSNFILIEILLLIKNTSLILFLNKILAILLKHKICIYIKYDRALMHTYTNILYIYVFFFTNIFLKQNCIYVMKILLKFEISNNFIYITLLFSIIISKIINKKRERIVHYLIVYVISY